MARYVLYVYTVGSDLDDVAPQIERAVRDFVDSGGWRLGKPLLVNQRYDPDPSHGSGDLPDSDLGLNIKLENPDLAPPGWFSDVERTVDFFCKLREETKRDFVIGIGDTTRPWFSNELLWIEDRTPDLTHLRRILGADKDMA